MAAEQTSRHRNFHEPVAPAAARRREVTNAAQPEDGHLAGASADHDNPVEGEAEAAIYVGEPLDGRFVLGDNRSRLRMHPSSPVERGQPIRHATDGAAWRVPLN